MNLTIIIPTIDYREALVSRSIQYYRNLSINIIIVDGSKKFHNYKLKSNEKHFHLCKLNFMERVIYGVAKAKTKYVAICQDDDFLNHKSLQKGIKFLDSNSDYSFLNGVDIYFEKFLNKFYLTQVYPEGKHNFYSSDNLYKRFKQIKKTKTQMTASLFRQKHILKALNSFQNLKLNEKNELRLYDEIAFSLFPIMHGRYKCINEIWQIRDRAVYPYYKKKHDLKKSNSIINISKKEFLNLPETNKLKKYFYNHIKHKEKSLSFDDFSKDFNSEYLFENKVLKQFTPNSFKIFFKKKLSYLFDCLKFFKKFIRIIFLEKNLLIDSKKDQLFISNEWKVIHKYLIKFNKETKKIDLT
ncbi:TIGR00180 family glycosyltransferase [Candidatus Pelagibacter sp.]|nr:TIGR00180 family glycosyltransferase [Candidatus Pelagibacter sp.]